MRKTTLSNLLSVFTLTMCVSLLAAPGLAAPQSDQKSKQEQEKSDSKDEKESGKKEDEKKSAKSKKQTRTGTQRIGRMLKSSRASDEMIAIMNPLTASASESTVAVMSGKKQIALGMIVDSSGLILTKSSELAKDLKIVAGGESYEASVYGIDSKTDLAMLKIDAENLPVANLNPVEPPALGSWLACAGPGQAPFSLGIVAVEARRIKGSRAFVGIMPVDYEKGNGVRIDSVTADSPADKSGLRINDVILKIDDAVTDNRTQLRAKLAKQEPGDRVTLKVLRGEKEIDVDLELAPLNAFAPERINQQNRMGSVLSKRRSDFPLVFQTDAGINADQCGGPLVDLQGNIVGISISRAERVSSLVIPVQTILPVIELLRSGDLSPAVVNKQQISNIEEEIAELSKTLDVDAQEKRQGKLKLKVEVAQARRDEIEKAIAELQLRLEKIEDFEEEEAELKELNRELFSGKRKLKKLEEKRQSLINGF